MRLTSLKLTRYGNFDSEHLTFDPRPGVLNLLLAPNGGGKSVLRAAFCDLLFGIGGQSPMGFRYGYPSMRIAAEAVGPDNRPVAFGRRKGQGNTLLDASGSALDPAIMAPFIGRIDRQRLERLFALDTDRLRQGETDLLASDGELGAALVSGTGGARDLRALRKRLEDERDALAPLRRSASRPFYLGVDKFVEARKRKEASLLKPDHWLRQQAELDAALLRQTEQNRIAAIESSEIARLERIRRVLPWLAAHDLALAWLDAHADAPVLDPALMKQLGEARSAIVIAEHAVRRAMETAAALAEQFVQTTVNEDLVAEGDEIDALAEAAGAARKAKTDLPSVVSEQDAVNATIAGCLRELGLSLTAESAAHAIPPRAVVNQARRLIQSYSGCQEAAQKAPATVAERERERDATAAQQAALVPPGNVSDLEAFVKDIRADGDPVRRLRDAAVRRTEAESILSAALARVPGWTEGDAALLTLAPLPPDTYERHAKEVADARVEATAQLQALVSARRARDEAREGLAAFTATSPLPDEAGLSHARSRRDQGWQLIYRRAFTADPPGAQEERDFAGQLTLPQAYERAVTSADSVADRRVQEAGVLASAQQAQAVVKETESRFLDAETRHRIVAETQQATERVWAQLCGKLPLGESPVIRAVQTFLTARDKVIDARQARDAAQAAEAALESTHAGWAARLGAMLAAEEKQTLPDLLTLAERRLDEAQQAGKRLAALQAKRDAADKALAEAQATQHQAGAALAKWQEDWGRAMQELGRPSGEDPRATEDVLQVFVELDQAQKAYATLVGRIAGMRHDVDRFAEDAAVLAARVAPELDRADPFLLAASLRTRLQQARERAKQRDLLREQSAKAANAAAQAESQRADRQAALQAVLSLTGGTTVEEAERRLILAADRAGHAAALTEAESKLTVVGDMRPLPDLRQEVATVPVEEILGRIDAAANRRNDAQSAAQDAAATASGLAQRMKQSEEATGATDAAADQQAAVASMARVLEEALVHHVAAEMLDRALAAIERDSEPALLRRISTLFATLTGGVYARVLTEIGDDNLTRLSLLQRDFPDERQSVRDLSEGTRDQLFLALRLAAIEEHAASAPALPFIGDDILQTFDDDRALAALRVLGGVSEKVQVILLTHHRHVLDLAARLPAGSVHVCRIGSEMAAA